MGSSHSQPTLPTMSGSWGVGPSDSSLGAVLRAPYPPFNGPRKGLVRAVLRTQGLLDIAKGEAELQGLPGQALAPSSLTLF